MDLRRLRFGDWVMGIGGLAVLVVMFIPWYEPRGPNGEFLVFWEGDSKFNAWEAFGVNDVILAIAALLAVSSFVLTALQPTAAVPLALASLGTVVSLIAIVLVTWRVIWPPELAPDDVLDTARLGGAWLGLVATTTMLGGCLASIRDQRLPRSANQVEPRLVEL